MIRIRRLTGFSRVSFCVLLALAVFGWQPAQTRGANQASAPEGTAQAASPAAAGPSRDLSRDEAEGGHTLRKHVGRTDDELRERLRLEPRITAASTWNDRETAESAVGSALDQNRDKIEGWLNRQGGHPNLVVDYHSDPAHPIGRTLRRGGSQPKPCSHAVIVLKWAGSNRYYVLTSYPECHA
jgi:Bacterial CdiA-CT RNAse A domain